jgi:hypothetical protein
LNDGAVAAQNLDEERDRERFEKRRVGKALMNERCVLM